MDPLCALREFISRHRRLFVLTGAGCSTASGIPDYRDRDGRWKCRRPVMYQDFVHSAAVRRRYWARSALGWPAVDGAQPNRAHRALAALESAGRLTRLVTQNVDGLHQRAGSRKVIDLHGRLDAVECLHCRETAPRPLFQDRLVDLNPWLTAAASVPAAPDADAHLEAPELASVRIPPCVHCGGPLKPAVTFFGEAVPPERVAAAHEALARADAMLVVGSSLMVYSGYRFCRAAREQGKAIAAVNQGRTRADAELTVKIDDDCGRVLHGVVCDTDTQAMVRDPVCDRATAGAVGPGNGAALRPSHHAGQDRTAGNPQRPGGA